MRRGGYNWNILDEKHTLLFNHLYEYNHTNQQLYFIKKIRQVKPDESSAELLLYKGSQEAEWVKEWRLRTSTSDEIVEKIITKIQKVSKGEKIETMNLHEKGIYIGEFTLDKINYPVAIYSEKAVIENITKVQVSEIDDLENDENIKHFQCKETFIKYLVLAFYEEDNNEPVLVMQIEKFDISEKQSTKKKWLEYLEIIGEPKKIEITQAQLVEIFPDTDTTRLNLVMEVINNNSIDFKINTVERMSHFLGQIGTETGGMKDLSENDCYSESTIKNIFGKVIRNGNTRWFCDLFEGYNSTSLNICSGNAVCDCNPVLPDSIPMDSLTVKSKYICNSALFDYTYACRLGNGNPSTKDGSKYKGKGFIQLTGKEKYKRINDEWNKMYPNDPKEFHGKDIELLETDIEIAMKASMICWKIQGLNRKADIGMTDEVIDNVGSIVNGSGDNRPNGADHRIEYTKAAYNALKK